MAAPSFMAGFRSLDEEVSERELPVSGSIPDWLAGDLVRNGPGRFEVGGERVRHWFDGLAMLRRYRFADGGVTYTNRFLRTEAYEAAQDGTLSGQFGTDRSGLGKILAWLRRLGPPEPTDNANVHVARIDGDLVALTEVPRWVRVAEADLGTLGEFDFEDDLSLDMTTAHLTADPHAEELVGFGLSFGRTHTYEVFRIPADECRREHIASIPTSSPAYIHDCGVTEDHVVLVETPLRIAILKAFSPFTDGFLDLLSWAQDRETTVIVVDRATGAVERWDAPALFTFHTANAFTDEGDVVLDLVAFEDHGIVDALGFAALEERDFADVPPGYLTRFRLGADGVEETTLHEGGVELPVVAKPVRTRRHRYVYAQATDPDGANGLAKIDTDGNRTETWYEDGVYLEEPRVVQHPVAKAEDEGVVLVPAIDSTADVSELLVFDAASLSVRARATLPHQHPFGFHGRFFHDG